MSTFFCPFSEAVSWFYTSWLLVFIGFFHSHSSVETSDRRVDEASDDGVQDEGQNLRRMRK